MKNMVPFDAPLHPLDTETQTYGCRMVRCDRCMYHSMERVCAFVCEDGVCKRPNGKWRQQYLALSGQAAPADRPVTAKKTAGSKRSAQ